MKDGIVLNATVNRVNDGAISITSLKCHHLVMGAFNAILSFTHIRLNENHIVELVELEGHFV